MRDKIKDFFWGLWFVISHMFEITDHDAEKNKEKNNVGNNKS